MGRRSAIFQRAAAEWNEMRADYDLYLEAHIEAAAEACSDALLNERGRNAGIRVHELFLQGPQFTAAYASEELLDFWRGNPRMTLAEFEDQWPTLSADRPAA